MLINLKVKTLDARTHEFSIDNEITIREFKDQIAEKTNIAAENQRIIYQGRVLADDKQVKEYDVDGKVLHVAERPPFSQRGANATNNDEPMRFRNMMGGRPTPRNLRNSPYFRTLDGMLVGTMAIPVNNGPLAPPPGIATPPNRFPNSSSFCINRITVALHMIDCANNIAAYLENPEVGLNNQSLDILQRGRWTMESTVVEVGVSSTDMPRNNNIIDMVQDAVTAALSRNTPGRNYTVVQLPTVYTNEGGDGAGAQQRGTGNEGDNSAVDAAAGDGDAATGGGGEGESDTSEETTAAAAVIIEDVIETDDEAADAGVTEQGDDERSPSLQEAAGAVGGAADAAGTSEENAVVTGIGPRRRTRPQVLANVIQRYRTVQTRLAPFVDAYYEILEQDPTFEENDTTRRENSQRIFDRVSEAFHYLSHAQHAISDLMLDLSQPGPRVLTCRPILVEQSGYIRSNNIFTPNLVASPFTDLIGQAPPIPTTTARANETATGVASGATAAAQATQGAQQEPGPVEQSQNTLSMQERIDNDLRNVFGAEGAEEISAGAAEAAAAAAVVAGRVSTSDRVEDPVDEPMVAPSAAAGAEQQQQQQQQRPEMDEHEERSVAGGDEAPTPRLRLYMPVRLPPPNPQVQMARLIQAVVNSATNDGDLHVEFNAPNIMSINLPVHVMTAAVHPPQARPAAAGNTDNANAGTGEAGAVGEQPSTAAGATSAGAGVGTASTSSGTRSGEQRANTLPTTATQTRSTSRPQIQIGGNNNWAGRIAPTHTAFDRFLPCNSHHIREPEPLPQNNNNNNNNTASSSSNNANVGQANNRSTSGTRRPSRTGASNSLLIASRLPRNQIGSGHSRPLLRRRSAISRERRTGSSSGGTGASADATDNDSSGGNTSSSVLNQRRILTPSQSPPLQRTLSRLLSNMYDNFLVTNMRNHAQTAGGGTIAPSATALVLGEINRLTNEATHATGNANATSPSRHQHAAAAATVALLTNAINGNSRIPVSRAGAAAAAASVTSSLRRANNLRTQMRNFMFQNVFEGSPINAETTRSAIRRALNWFGDSLAYLPQYERPEYNSHDSVCNTLRQSLQLIIDLCIAPTGTGSAGADEFEEVLKQICEQFRKRLYSVLFVCLGSANAELYWRQLMRLLCVPLRSNFRNEALQFLCIYIDPTIPVHMDTADAQQFLVLRSDQTAAQPKDKDQQQQATPASDQLDNDVEMDVDVASSSSSSAIDLEPPLPVVIVGSEPWHNNLPNDWLPAITRDLQTQTEQTRSQPPYSDAYISGMSAKRRKIIQSEKPTQNVECLIASGVQRAIQSAGLSTSNAPGGQPLVNPDVVIGAIAHDAAVQASYTEAVRNNARERLKQDIDYKPSKYPQIAKFTEQQK